MEKKDLIDQLKTIKDSKRIYRDKTANFIIQNPEVFPYLLELVFNNNKDIGIKSAWALELVYQKNSLFFKKHIHYFVNNLNKIKEESALRPISKVCSFLARDYQSNKIELSMHQKEIIIEQNFDWLIANHKIATQVFAMETLYLLGSTNNWVHDELKSILEKNIQLKSAGYQSRAKKILKKLGQ